jgi:hypothetical protein
MKYLWTLALAALCVGALSGSAFALAGDSWAVAGSDLPSALGWDRTYDASVDAENDGANDWAVGYELWSCEGSTSGGITLIDAWGLDLVPATGPTDPIPMGETSAMEFTVTAPPVTGTLECDWVMSDGANVFPAPLVLAEADVDVTRFPDVDSGHWAFKEIEGCGGMVPFIVAGFPDGYYRPTVTVRRDAMAVFVRRGMDVTQTIPATASFPDVPTDFWAYGDIETLVAEGVVQGYPSGYYRPNYTVTRDQMAVYIARAKGFDLSPPETADVFPDVPVGHWAIEEIDACVDNAIVLGYPDGLYRPLAEIDRAQLAVYTYRAFIDPDDPAVVVGGPDVTAVNVPGALAAWGQGWSGTDTDPAWAYVVFDNALLDTAMATDNGGTWDITFDFRDAATATVAGTTVTVPVNAAAISAAAGAYFTVATSVPALAAGDYTLVVIVEDKQGDLIELLRTTDFTVS